MAFGFGWLKGLAIEFKELKFATPTKFAQQREISTLLREPLHQRAGIVHATSTHEIPVMATLGKVFEELTDHPLLGKFMRHKPQLFVVHPDMVVPGLGQIKGAQIFGKKVFIDALTVDNMPIEQTAALLAHELAHHARLDTHARNAYRFRFRRAMPFMEANADKIAVAVTGDAETLDLAIKRLKEIHPVMAESDKIMHSGSVLNRGRLAAANGAYLPPEERSKYILAVGESINTPEKRSHVQAEIERRLAKEHDRVFGTNASYKNYPSL